MGAGVQASQARVVRSKNRDRRGIIVKVVTYIHKLFTTVGGRALAKTNFGIVRDRWSRSFLRLRWFGGFAACLSRLGDAIGKVKQINQPNTREAWPQTTYYRGPGGPLATRPPPPPPAATAPP